MVETIWLHSVPWPISRLTLSGSGQGAISRLLSAAKVEMGSHQADAALFAFQFAG
jgi:hypothetical protein